MWIQGSDKHETLVHDLVNLGNVRGDTDDAVFGKCSRSVAEKSSRPERVCHNYWLEHIEFEMSIAACHRSCNVVSHDLGTHHGDGFTLGGIHFSGHDRTTWFIFREGKLAQTATRSTCQKPYVVGNLKVQAKFIG